MRHTGTQNQKETLTERAGAIQGITKEEAKRRYDEACYTIRALGGENIPPELWHEKKQMDAILNKKETH